MAVQRPFNPFLTGGLPGGGYPPLMNPQPMAQQQVPMRPPVAAPPMRRPPPTPPTASFQKPQAAGASALPPMNAPRQGNRFGNFLGSDSALGLAAGILEGGTTGQALGRGFKYALATRQNKGSTTDDLREYAFAKSQGYPGSFADYMREMKAAGAQKNIGTPPAGYAVQYDQAGNPVSMAPVPGGPADQEAQAAEASAEAAQQSDVDKARTMLGLTSNIRKEFENAETPVTGTLSRPFATFSGTPAGRVRSYTRTLQSGVALNAMMRLKAASSTGATGFGAMNEKELDLLINDIGALDPDTTEPDIFLSTLDEIEARAKRVVEDIKRNVAPERIRELGLEPLLSEGLAAGGGATGEGAAPLAPGTYDYIPGKGLVPQ